jgi:hypothetical protein
MRGRAIGCGPGGCKPVEFDTPDLPRGHAPGRCKHFTGLFGPGMVKHEQCSAGVRYRDVEMRHDPLPYEDRRGTTYRTGLSLPCLRTPGGNPAGATCEMVEWPTEEEVAQDEAYTKALVRNVNEAFRRANSDPAEGEA